MKHKHKWQFVKEVTYTNPGEPQETVFFFVCECGKTKSRGWNKKNG